MVNDVLIIKINIFLKSDKSLIVFLSYQLKHLQKIYKCFIASFALRVKRIDIFICF